MVDAVVVVEAVVVVDAVVVRVCSGGACVCVCVCVCLCESLQACARAPMLFYNLGLAMQ